jgi:hypothetical protein
MLHIDPQHTKKLPAADNQQPVKPLSAHGTDHRSATALAFGA